MAEVWLSREEAERGDLLPCVCMQCGAPATDIVSKHYTSDNAPLPPDPIIGGLLLFPLWALIALLKLLSWSSAASMTVRTPLCHRHAHGWFTGTSLEATSITVGSIVLDGVSDRFARELHRQRRPTLPRETMIVR